MSRRAAAAAAGERKMCWLLHYTLRGEQCRGDKSNCALCQVADGPRERRVMLQNPKCSSAGRERADLHFPATVSANLNTIYSFSYICVCPFTGWRPHRTSQKATNEFSMAIKVNC